MIKFLKKLYLSNKGATAVDYVLILALIAIAAVVAIGGVAGETVNVWNHVANRVTEVS